MYLTLPVPVTTESVYNNDIKNLRHQYPTLGHFRSLKN